MLLSCVCYCVDKNTTVALLLRAEPMAQSSCKTAVQLGI